MEAAKEGAASYVDWMIKCDIFHTFAMNIMPAAFVTVLPIGGSFVQSGTLTTSDFILVVILALGLITPIINCMSFQDDLEKLKTVMGEVTEIVNAKEMPRPIKDNATPLGDSIQLSDVHFPTMKKKSSTA